MGEDVPDFFSDPAVIEDPKTYLKLVRSKCPVLKEAYHGSLMVTGYDEVMDVLTRKGDTLSSAVSVIGPMPPLPFKPEGDDIRAQVEEHRDMLPWSQHLTAFDGKKHTDARSLLTPLLTSARLNQNERYLEGIANQMIDKFIGQGRCDVVPDYAHAITVYAISDLMGIPEADRPELLKLIGAPPSQVQGDAAHKVGPDPLVFMKERFDGYIHDRLETPRDDLLSELTHSRYKDGSSPEPAMVSLLARFLFGAGQDTTSRLIAMAIKTLAEDSTLQKQLRDDAARIPDFIEEVLRYDAPVKTVYRLVQKSTEIGGVKVPAGTIVTVALTGASNDPRHFENPEEFNPNRPRVRDHLAFGRGFHACLGAPLARLESRVALQRFLARLSDIRISDEYHGPTGARLYRYEPTYAFRSLSDLHVEFKAA